MPVTPPTAVVFDLGGVLIDWNPRYLYRQLFDDEAEWRIGLMRQHGPTAEAFTFRSPFGPPAASRRRGPAIDAEFCWAG